MSGPLTERERERERERNEKSQRDPAPPKFTSSEANFILPTAASLKAVADIAPPEDIKLCSCSTQLSMKFNLLISSKML